ncbi:MAG: TonB-dependent receptor [Betaproteobacteria bacterium]
MMRRERVQAMLLAILLDGIDPVAAQAPEPQANDPIRVEVTGSRIARVDAETALPIQTITRDEIDRAGWTTASEIMAHVSASFNGMTPAMSIGNGGSPGLSSANLRGIGDGNTLVLLNGRRLSNYAFLSGAPNIDVIPVSVIDRVEILKDGASSIYGTDAIAGVVNFITRKDYRGVDVTGFADLTEHRGGNAYQASLAAGWGDLAKDRFNVFASLDWHREESIAARDRAYAASGNRPGEGFDIRDIHSIPANLDGGFIDGTVHWLNPAFAAGCAPPLSLPATEFRFGEGEMCLTGPGLGEDIAPTTERWTGFGRATWQFAAGHEVFAEYLYSRTQMTLRTRPTPASEFTTIDGAPLLYPEDGPYYPAEYAAAHGLSGPLEVFYRTIPLGPRTEIVTTDAERLTIGAQGTVGSWSYGAGFSHSENRADDEYVSGFVQASRLLPAMATGLINPFGASTQSGLDLLASTQFEGAVRSARAVVEQFDAQLSRDWIRLPGGNLAIAFGGEWRRESLDDRPAPILDTGDVIGAPFEISPQSATRSVGAVSAETSIPFAKGWELLGSVRYDHYSDFGGTTNPKLAVRWQPSASWLVRGSWGTGFRAPTLTDLYEPPFAASAFGLEDPVRCPVTQTPDDCGVGGFTTIYGGNPALSPETSTQVTAGFVWEPVAGFSIGADAWRIAKHNVIGALPPDVIVDNYDAYAAGRVLRGPPDPAYPGLPGPIQRIVGISENLGELTTAGVDIALRARLLSTAVGQLALSLDGTYVHSYTIRLPGVDADERAGRYALSSDAWLAVPRWRHYAQLAWQRGTWGATLAQTFQAGATDRGPNADGNPRRVGSYSLWDLQGTWTWQHRATLALGVRNLFDTDPPFSNASFGFDPAYAQTRGRSYDARLSYAFR